MNIFDFKAYDEYVKTMPKPWELHAAFEKEWIDLRGLRDYAVSRGVEIAALSQEEKEKFIHSIEE